MDIIDYRNWLETQHEEGRMLFKATTDLARLEDQPQVWRTMGRIEAYSAALHQLEVMDLA